MTIQRGECDLVKIDYSESGDAGAGKGGRAMGPNPAETDDDDKGGAQASKARRGEERGGTS